jgi:hypothetical protein
MLGLGINSEETNILDTRQEYLKKGRTYWVEQEVFAFFK